MPSLVSQSEFDAYIRTDANIGTTDAVHRASALAAAEQAVSEFCQRSFAVVAEDAVATTRYYVPDGTEVLRIHDARAVTAITNNGATIASSGYQLEPVGVSWAGRTRPYEQVRLLASWWQVNYPGEATVAVTGRFGWVAVPPEVVEATKILGKDILQQRSTVGNLVSTGDFGGRVAMNTYVQRLLAPLRRVESWGIA